MLFTISQAQPVQSVVVDEPGDGYMQDRVTASVEADESIELSVVLLPARIASVSVDTAGTGYTYANATIDSVTVPCRISSGGVAEVILPHPDTTVAQDASVEITGDGTGAAASLVLQGAGVASIEVDDPGATLYLAAPTVAIDGDGDGDGAEAHVLLGRDAELQTQYRADLNVTTSVATIDGDDYEVGPPYPIPQQFIAPELPPFSTTARIAAYQLDEQTQVAPYLWQIRTQADDVDAENYWDLFLERAFLDGGFWQYEPMATVHCNTAADIAGDVTPHRVEDGEFEVPLTEATDLALIINAVANGDPGDLTIYSTVTVRNVIRAV